MHFGGQTKERHGLRVAGLAAKPYIERLKFMMCIILSAAKPRLGRQGGTYDDNLTSLRCVRIPLRGPEMTGCSSVPPRVFEDPDYYAMPSDSGRRQLQVAVRFNLVRIYSMNLKCCEFLMQEMGRVTVQTGGTRKTLESAAMNRARTVPRQRATGERARRSYPGLPQLVASVVALKGLGALPLKFARRRGWLSPGLAHAGYLP